MGSPHPQLKFKTQNFLNTKNILVAAFAGFLILFMILRSNLSPAAPQTVPATSKADEYVASCPIINTSSRAAACNKIPSPLAQALVHYAASNTTPQQTFKEISVTARVLERKSPCKFLVFGLGHDSLMWRALNHGGRTVFLEEDKAWIDELTSRFPELEAHHVEYDTRVSRADELMREGKGEACRVVEDPGSSNCMLKLKGVGREVYEEEWDAIMVDAPTGYFEAAPGRMGAIWTAGMMARNRGEGDTDVFVHDVNRPVEDAFSREFLCEGYMKEQQGRLRHFNVPGHKDTSIPRPFCP